MERKGERQKGRQTEVESERARAEAQVCCAVGIVSGPDETGIMNKPDSSLPSGSF